MDDELTQLQHMTWQAMNSQSYTLIEDYVRYVTVNHRNTVFLKQYINTYLYNKTTYKKHKYSNEIEIIWIWLWHAASTCSNDSLSPQARPCHDVGLPYISSLKPTIFPMTSHTQATQVNTWCAYMWLDDDIGVLGLYSLECIRYIHLTIVLISVHWSHLLHFWLIYLYLFCI